MLWLNLIKLLLLLQTSQVLSLRCYQCRSTTSWEDCISRQKVQPCTYGPLYSTCLTFHRLKIQYGKKIQEFTKSCFHTSLCRRESCFETDEGKVTWCDTSCCNTTLCNQIVKTTAHRNSNVLPLLDSTLRSTTGSKSLVNPVPRYPIQTLNYGNLSSKSVHHLVPREGQSLSNNSETIPADVSYVTVAMAAMSVFVTLLCRDTY